MNNSNIAHGDSYNLLSFHNQEIESKFHGRLGILGSRDSDKVELKVSNRIGTDVIEVTLLVATIGKIIKIQDLVYNDENADDLIIDIKKISGKFVFEPTAISDLVQTDEENHFVWKPTCSNGNLVKYVAHVLSNPQNEKFVKTIRDIEHTSIFIPKTNTIVNNIGARAVWIDSEEGQREFEEETENALSFISRVNNIVEPDNIDTERLDSMLREMFV